MWRIEPDCDNIGGLGGGSLGKKSQILGLIGNHGPPSNTKKRFRVYSRALDPKP